MKKLFPLALALTAALTAAAGGNGPIFSTTIDFLDYVFADKEGSDEYYPVEVYEKRLKEIADCGIKKVYLRVNCLGLTLYPTKVATLYGEGGALHWSSEYGAKRLANTVRRYDVCKETIQIAHKYGMEAWAWESLADDGYPAYNAPTRELAEKFQGRPLIDPYFLAHPEGLAMGNPRHFMPKAKADRLTAEARKYPVGRIVVNNTKKFAPIRITADTLEIYTSQDNIEYTRYNGPFKVEQGVDSKGLGKVTISGLKISAPYIKLSHRVPFDTNFSVGLFESRDQNEIYNTRGQLVASTWGANDNDHTPAAVKTTGSLTFDLPYGVAWDYKQREIGCYVGIRDDIGDRYFIIAEFTVPGTMEHKVARFAELAAYPFDGFMLNWRTHSRVRDPNDYGFNPEVRKKFKERFGKDIWRDKFDLGDLLSLRAEAIGDYYRECKRLIGERPLYVSGLRPVPPGQTAPQKDFIGMGVSLLANLPMQYERWIKEGSIDGVMMVGGDFSSIFTDKLTGGRPVKLGIFREASGHLHRLRPKNYDFAADVKMLSRLEHIDEVELYETLELTGHPEKRAALREVTGGGGK